MITADQIQVGLEFCIIFYRANGEEDAALFFRVIHDPDRSDSRYVTIEEMVTGQQIAYEREFLMKYGSLLEKKDLARLALRIMARK